jgi:putative FmdB family regulatory protein
MPTYEYECEECGNVFDCFQKMSDDPLTECPKCGGSVRRLIGPGSGIIFKGKGFYATDYKSQTGSTRCGKDSPCCGKDVPCEKRPCD